MRKQTKILLLIIAISSLIIIYAKVTTAETPTSTVGVETEVIETNERISLGDFARAFMEIRWRNDMTSLQKQCMYLHLLNITSVECKDVLGEFE